MWSSIKPRPTRSGISLAYLLLGEYAKGWRYYEARFATENFKDCRSNRGFQPESLQECPARATPLVVWTEQGIGDAIQFERYLHLLRAQVFLSC